MWHRRVASEFLYVVIASQLCLSASVLAGSSTFPHTSAVSTSNIGSILSVRSYCTIEDRAPYHFIKFAANSPYATLRDFRVAWFDEVETPLSQGSSLEQILGVDFQERLLDIGPLFGVYSVDEPKWTFDQRLWSHLEDQPQIDLLALLKDELPDIKDKEGHGYSLDRAIEMHRKATDFLKDNKVNLSQDAWLGSDYSFYVVMTLQERLVDDLRRLGADPLFRILAYGDLDSQKKIAASLALLKEQYKASTDKDEQWGIHDYIEKLEHARLYAKWFPSVYALIELSPDLQSSGGLALDIGRYDAATTDGVYYRTLIARAFPEEVETIKTRVVKAKEDYRQAWEAIRAIGEKRKSIIDYYLLADEGLKETFGRSFNPLGANTSVEDHDKAIQVAWNQVSKDREYMCEMGDRDLQHRVAVPGDPLVQGNLIHRKYADRFPIRFSPTIHTEYEDNVVTPGDILTQPIEVTADLDGHANISGGGLLLTANQYQTYVDQRESLYKGHASTAGLQALQDMLMVGGALGMVGKAGAVGEGVTEVRALSQLKWLRRGALAEMFSLVPRAGVAQARLANLFWFGVAANAIGVGVSSVYDSLVSGHVMLPHINDLLVGSRDTGMLALFSFGVLSRIPGMQSPLVASSALFGTGTALTKMQGGTWTQSLLMGTKLASFRFLGPRYLAQAGVSFGVGAAQNLIEGSTISSQGRVMQNPWDAGAGAISRFSGFDGLGAASLAKKPGQTTSGNPDVGSREPFQGKTPDQIWKELNTPRSIESTPYSNSGSRSLPNGSVELPPDFRYDPSEAFARGQNEGLTQSSVKGG
jgi:hypothetical protein